MIHPEAQDPKQTSQLTWRIKRVRVLADRGQASPPTPSLATSAWSAPLTVTRMQSSSYFWSDAAGMLFSRRLGRGGEEKLTFLVSTWNE